MKAWMISDNAEGNSNVFDFLANVFGMSPETFVDGDLVLNVEAVAWSRISSKNAAQYGYTAYTIAKLYQMGVANHSLLNSFWLGRFQSCGLLEQSWSGLTAPSSGSLSEKASNTSGWAVIHI